MVHVCDPPARKYVAQNSFLEGGSKTGRGGAHSRKVRRPDPPKQNWSPYPNNSKLQYPPFPLPGSAARLNTANWWGWLPWLGQSDNKGFPSPTFRYTFQGEGGGREIRRWARAAEPRRVRPWEPVVCTLNRDGSRDMSLSWVPRAVLHVRVPAFTDCPRAPHNGAGGHSPVPYPGQVTLGNF